MTEFERLKRLLGDRDFCTRHKKIRNRLRWSSKHVEALSDLSRSGKPRIITEEDFTRVAEFAKTHEYYSNEKDALVGFKGALVTSMLSWLPEFKYFRKDSGGPRRLVFVGNRGRQ
jgi:hypothetical protein